MLGRTMEWVKHSLINFIYILSIINDWPVFLYSWSGIVYGLTENLDADDEDNIKAEQKTPKLNVVIYGFDSLSRNSFIRKLPKSYEYLTNQLKGDVLQGYNIVGDGTPQALIPLLTGFNELELPETRKRMKNSQFVDEAFPFVWKEYEREGYVTAFNEDIPNVGTFSYRLNGFKVTPTTHYMRTYYLAIDPEIRNYKKLCVGKQPRHLVMMNYTTQVRFMDFYGFFLSFYWISLLSYFSLWLLIQTRHTLCSAFMANCRMTRLIWLALPMQTLRRGWRIWKLVASWITLFWLWCLTMATGKF